MVEYYEHYTLKNTPDPQTVPDQDIIRDCAAHNWALITADGKMEYRHFSSIKQSDLAIFIVPNNDTHPRRWAEAMIKGRNQIYRAISNYQFPFVARLHSSGTIHQLRCLSKADTCPADSALLIKDGKMDHDRARENRKKAGQRNE